MINTGNLRKDNTPYWVTESLLQKGSLVKYQGTIGIAIGFGFTCYNFYILLN
jgi:hypothetical protein